MEENNNAIDLFTKDKDGDDGGEKLVEQVVIKDVSNGYILEITFSDGEELTEVYHELDHVFESIRNVMT